MARGGGGGGGEMDPELLLLKRSRGVWLAAYAGVGASLAILVALLVVAGAARVLDPLLVAVVGGLLLYTPLRMPVTAVRRLHPRLVLAVSLLPLGVYAGVHAHRVSLGELRLHLISFAVCMALAVGVGLALRLAMDYSVAVGVGCSLTSLGGYASLVAAGGRPETLLAGVAFISLAPLLAWLPGLLGLPAAPTTAPAVSSPRTALGLLLGSLLGVLAGRGRDHVSLLAVASCLAGLAAGYLWAGHLHPYASLLLVAGEALAAWGLAVLAAYTGLRHLERGWGKALLLVVVASIASSATLILLETLYR